MSPPNILFLITDQQQAATVNPTSPCQTSNLDRLSTGAVRFSRAYTVNAICSPTRASLFTGMLPHTHGMVDCTHTVEDYRARFRKGLTLWSQRLEQMGYRTGYFGKWHVERSNQLDEFGFAEYELHASKKFKAYQNSLGLPPQAERFVKRHLVKQPGYRDCPLYGVIDGEPEETSEYYLYSQGIKFLQKAAQDQSKPWCLTISTTAPHDPYFALKRYYDLYPTSEIEQPPNFHDDLKDKPNIYRRMQDVWREMRWAHFAEATACYYAICTLIDDQVGRILNVLEGLGQLGDTIIIYMSDHGDFMGAHRLMMKGVPAFEEGYKIPFIVRWPGDALEGAVCDEPVSVVDIAPTLLEMVGAEPIENCEGRSLLPLLKGERPEGWESEAFAEFHGQRFFFTQRIVWGERYKYIFNGFDYDELYDLEHDPHELRNLASDPAYRSIRDELATRMWKRVHETGDHNMYNAHYGTLRFGPVGPNVGS